jgi:hypothetical protein
MGGSTDATVTQDGYNPRFINIDQLTAASPMVTEIFNFSIRVGALVTYLLTEAMNPKRTFLAAIMESEKEQLTQEQKYHLALAWLRNCLITALPTLLYRYRETVTKGVARSNPQQHGHPADKFLQLMQKRQRHAFSEEVYAAVSDAFAEAFPATSRALNRMTAKLPQQIESIYDDGYIERAHPDADRDSQITGQRRSGRKNPHVHDFLPPRLKNNMKHSRCRICGKEQIEPIVSRSEKWTNIA